MNHDLIERYIYAVTRNLPPRMRDDVQKELDSLIADMLTERCSDISPTDKDVRVVLTELGTPGELAAKYSGDENGALISGLYFHIYKRILKLVLPIVAAVVVFSTILAACLEWKTGQNPFITFAEAFGQVLSGLVLSEIIAFAIITFIFAVFEHNKVDLGAMDMFSNLPPIPKKEERMKPYEPISGIVLCVIAAVLFIVFPEFAGAWIDGVGWIPVFVPSVLHGAMIFILLWAALGIARESVKLTEGRYTKRLAVVTVVCDILSAICAAVVFLNEKIMNPEFISEISDLFADTGADGRESFAFLANLNIILLGVVLFALILDAATTAFKAWKYG